VQGRSDLLDLTGGDSEMGVTEAALLAAAAVTQKDVCRNESNAAELAGLVTIVVNTSPIELHPSTILIEEILEALLGHVPALRRCPKLVPSLRRHCVPIPKGWTLPFL
jgi:hypothetical protein